MTRFDPEKGIIVVSNDHVDALHRLVTGPTDQRVDINETNNARLASSGIIDEYGLTSPAIPILRGMTDAKARYVNTRININDDLPLRNIRIWLSTPTATVERPDVDGVHIYAIDTPEIPHVVLANSHLLPRPNIIDGPSVISAALVNTLHTGDILQARKLMTRIGKSGPKDSTFATDARHAHLTLSMSYREELTEHGWTLTRHMTTLASSSALYQVITPAFGLTTPTQAHDNYDIHPIMATQAWAMISVLLAVEPATEQ